MGDIARQTGSDLGAWDSDDHRLRVLRLRASGGAVPPPEQPLPRILKNKILTEGPALSSFRSDP